jgi:hypothetical protein
MISLCFWLASIAMSRLGWLGVEQILLDNKVERGWSD